MEPIRVALLDDNELLAQSLQRVLGKDARFVWAGWATDRDRLMGLLASTPVDLVLVDVDLPGTDTFAVVRELAAQTPGIKAVMFSGHVRREYVDAAVDAGAYGYLSKDDDLESICDSLQLAHRGQPILSRVVRQALGAI